MARTPLTIRTITGDGNALVTEAADTVNGNSYVSGANTLLSFFAFGGGTVTIINPQYAQGDSSDGLKVPDRVLTLPAGVPFLWVCPMSYYDQPSGLVHIDYGQATSVAVYTLQG